MTIEQPSGEEHRARILDADDDELLARWLADPCTEVIDAVDAQQRTLTGLLPPPAPTASREPTRWAYYPWRRTVVAVVGPTAFRRARLDRNRNLISAADQQRLATLRVGVVGLSVGHAVAYTVAAQGVCGALRLADFDELELTNLNRVPATVFDLGVNKAIVAARRIAELDPYFDVDVMTTGLTAQTVGDFLDGIDILVEECDSLDMKLLVRQAARARRLPVLMATSDRGLVDIERFDLMPERPILHGLLGDVDADTLAGLSGPEKIPFVLRLIDAGHLSARGAASLLEIDHTLATWPQLAGDVAVGAGAVAEAIRRIGLGEPLASGRTLVDLGAALDGLDDPVAQQVPLPQRDFEPDPPAPEQPARPAESIAAAAIRAPSGGNVQPWRVDVSDESVTVVLDPENSATMDVAFRASAVAVGAALFNARVAAAALGVLGQVRVSDGSAGTPLCAVLTLGDEKQPDLAELYQPMLDRETNRHRGSGAPLDPRIAGVLASTAAAHGARLALLTEPEAISTCARILGAADRIRYLTPKLHADMIGELRWPGDPSPDTGIDLRSLELDPGRWALADILRRSDVMAELSAWGGGAALAADTQARVTTSSALAVVFVRGRALADYARGGSAMEAVWIMAQQNGVAVQPISPVFLYAHDVDELGELSPSHVEELGRLQREFIDLVGMDSDESMALVLRLFDGPKPSVRSRRRPLAQVSLRSTPGAEDLPCR